MRLRGGIAIVGMGCRYPCGADTPSRFWDLLAGGVDAVTEVPPERAGLAASSRWGGFVEAIDQFDAGFFGISPREARRIDPQQRLLLEVAWEALEDAGLPVDRLAGSATGVFVGVSGHDYADLQSRPDHRDLIDVHVNAGSATSIAANRISYQFDLRGPSVAVDTACSSALTALHLACASLDAGECDLALVGAVNALLTPEPSIGFAKAGMLSPTGRCRPFDAAADGYVRSEGAGVVVLKPLDEAIAAGDPIYAVIRATGVNQDGRTPGLTVPSPDAQQALMESVLADAGLSCLAVQYVEAHGTGTPVGDPREARAIGAVMAGRAEDRPCLVGSAKGNLGHLEAAAGMVGLMKVALALRHRHVPPSLHFTKPHPDVPFDELRLRVPTALEPWPDTRGAPAVAAVNSFGFGGANAHVVLEEAPDVAVAGDAGDGHLLVLSAHEPEALRDLAGRWVPHLAGRADVADACFTAAARRTHHEYRLAVAGRSAGELRASLAAVGDDDMVAARRDGRPRFAFVFTGMGPLTAGVGRQLATCEPVFAAVIDECDRVLEPLAGWSLRDKLLRDDTDSFVTQPRAAHVTNLALQLGLAALWRSWGVVPDAVAGHSSGEIAAACAAGAIDLSGAVTLAYHRGRLQQRKDGTGGMLAAGVAPADVAALVGADAGRVTLAAINGPASVTLAGDLDALERIAAMLDDQGRFRRMVPVTVPYHSPALDDLQDELEVAAGAVAAQLPTIPLASTVTGDWLNGRPLDPGYWWAGVRQPVQFAAAVDRLLASGCELVVEIGPHPVLAASVRECAAGAGRPVTVLPSLRRGEPERLTMLRTLGALHAHGVEVDWTGLYGGGRRVVPLPTYPWQRSRHWMASAPAGGHPLLGRRLATARPTWETDLGDDRLTFLDGHLVQDRVALPAAAYVEACVAATAGAGPVALGPVEFHRLLAGDRAGTILQVTEVDGGVEVHSSPAGGEWTLRASARRLASPPPASGVVELDAVRRRCRTLEVHGLYGALAGAGLRYQGAFRPLAELWAGDSEVLARLELPAPAGATDGWHVHPALLDGAFQAVAGVGVDLQAGAWLPVSIRRVGWYATLGTTGWCHATVTRRDGRLVEADVVLTDDHGSVVVRCQGLRVQRVGAASAEDPSRWFFEERWEPAPRVAATTAGDVASDVQPTVDEIAGRLHLSDFYDHVAPAIDALAVHYAREALAGLDPATVPDRHHRYLARLREIARTPATQPPEPNVLAAKYPTCRSVIELVRESGERLAATLRGDDDARQWMVAGPWLDTLTELYAVNPGFRAYSEVAAGVVHSLWRRNGDRRLRILEVGAGTGGATGAILDRLPEGATDYLATDISPFFVKVLRHHFGQRQGVRTAVFDVEDPTLDEGPFDVIVAADVVHATADVERTLATLRHRLAPGGALVLIEVLNRAPWLDLLFGQFEGWWRQADTVRPDHPLLDPQAWLDLLDRAGFEAAVVTDAGGADGTGPLQAVLVATLPLDATVPRPPHRWLVLTDRQGVGPEVAAALRESGDTCVLAWPGSSYRRYGADGFELVPEAVDDWARLLEDAGPVDGVVHLWSLDPPPAHDGAGLLAFQATTCGSVTALFAAAGAPVPPLWLVTAGSPAGAPLWGMGRVVRSERGAGACRLVQLGPDLADGDVAALVDELLAAPGTDLPESEIALRDGQRLARRLEPAPALAGSGPSTVDRTPDTATFRVAAPRPGALDSLVLREMPPAEPGPGEVAVRLLAGALNFRDVLVALGIGFAAGGEDPAAAPLGWEGAGVVEAIGEGVTGVRPGDHVMAMAAGSLGSRVVTRAGYVVPLPTGLRPEEAATLPVAFLTARYALERLGRLAAGERVLIHAASGGVGLAAVQLARLAGAEVLATAGTPEKRDYLRSIGIEHVMDSRSLDFAAEVMAATGGEGVDVVLNSLTGEAAARSVEVLRPFGRFVEIGKRDIYEGGQLDLAPFRRNLSYLALDLQPLYDGQPELIESMLRELAADVDAGRIQPLPYKAFDLGRAEEAFRHMAQARHIGKVVLTVRAPAYPVVALKTTRFRRDRTYVITGGLGGFGLAVARWMVGEGAGHLALLSRSGEPRPEDRAAFDAVVATGADVEVVRADVSRVDDLAAALSHVRATMPPLAGVVHAAMVLDDGLVGTLDWPRVEAVLAPKVAGAWNLHEATAGDDLDLFVLFSSISAAIGQPGQASYAAANAFLDALATHRRSLGLPALSVAWGVIAGAGYVSRHPDIQRRMARQGLLGITPEEACDALGRLLDAGRVRAVVSRGRWGAGVVEDSAAPPSSGRTAAATPSSVLRQVATGPPAERPGALERHLAEVASRVLEAPTAVDPERRLFDLGFDSLMAVELSTALRADLDVEVPIVDLLDDLTVRSLAERVLALLEGRSHG